MALKRLPNDVQSLLCASAQVNSYKKAVEELVYNSLDAKCTSIAIRIHIQENTIQVIDNGNGITKLDFSVVGQRYMTGKLIDISRLKAAPKNYGYRGEFLANIITVSQMVKITSRHESTEETWAKTFHKSIEKKIAKMSTRPTKGTTVDIKGFLYNLKIQKRRIDPMNEIQSIKLFLEQLSLVHNNISLSLRDDSKNDIVFKIHKKRDIYQTLSTLFDIDKADVLEFQVEKNEYRVKGLIKKTGKDFDMHWIYLNGRFMHSNSKIYKILNEHFRKYLLIKNQWKLKSKKNNEEHSIFNQNIPFYFIFITCPYIDYNISFTPRQSVIEFKNWDQINKLLEKFVKFYVGDVNQKDIKKSEMKLMNKEHTNLKYDADTRDQVKKIMDKILGRNSTILGVSQLQNGVKGKMAKRKMKKKNAKKTILPLLGQINNKKSFIDILSTKNYPYPIFEHNAEKYIQTLANNIDEHKKLINDMETPHPKPKVKPSPKKKKIEIKAKILSPIRYKKDNPSNIQKHKLNKYKHLIIKNDKPKTLKYFKNTDSVYNKSKRVAQRAEAFLQQTKKTKANLNSAQNGYKKNKKPILQKHNDCAIYNTPMPPNINNNIIEKYIMKKLKTNSYKTTYDLVQTIQISQQEINSEKNNVVEPCFREFYDYRHIRKDSSHCITMAQTRSSWENKYTFSKYSDIDGKQEVSQYTSNIPINYKNVKHIDNFSEYSNSYGHKEIFDFMPCISEASVCIRKNTDTHNYNIKHNEAKAKRRKLLTYDSHQCHRNEVFEGIGNTNSYTINTRQNNIRFITKQSRDHFINSRDLITKFKRSSKSILNKQSNIIDKCLRQSTDESYAIEYSKSNEKHCSNFEYNDMLVDNNAGYKENHLIKIKTNTNYGNELLANEVNSIFGNTYTIQPSNFSSRINNVTQNQTKIPYIKSKELFDTYSNSAINNENIAKKKTEGRNGNNIVFVSKPQCEAEVPLDNNNIEPLNVCEPILHESGTIGREFAFSFNGNNRLDDNTTLYNNLSNIDGTNERIRNGSSQMTKHQGNQDITENVSHHFSVSVPKHPNMHDNNVNDTLQHSMPQQRNDESNEFCRAEDLRNPHLEGYVHIVNKDLNIENNHFNFKNRLRFVPKGMSQIFENCHSKVACDYKLDDEYYEDSIYNNFANDVQVNAEIYEPIIQNVEDLTTRNIHKFQNKVKQDNASLVFDEKSLKEAKVLGQADCKFIAAVMKTRSYESEEDTEYLILLDQHAVHERIRLEKNLRDYIYEDKWASIPLDNILLKMSKDEILYLHNYKDKFSQLGLQWTILNDNEVTVHAIPVAVLGKNPREVEKVIKAVRNLIVEEICVIKLQKGCISLYPKSIMDLVFNEACRYAIKFGDQLSKNDCVDLLNALSDCKTPFQCAHGRPVMAVIMDVKCDKREYKVNIAKLNRFKPRITTNL